MPDKMTFDEWLKEVDKILMKRIGLTQDCLPDWLSYDTWETGTSPEGGAEECIISTKQSL